MPGSEDRKPADADRPPASRVGDELQERVDEMTTGDRQPDDSEMDAAEREAKRAADDKQWDQKATEREAS